MQGGFEVKVLECYQPRGIAKLAFCFGFGNDSFLWAFSNEDEETCGYIVYVLFFITPIFFGRLAQQFV